MPIPTSEELIEFLLDQIRTTWPTSTADQAKGYPLFADINIGLARFYIEVGGH